MTAMRMSRAQCHQAKPGTARAGLAFLLLLVLTTPLAAKTRVRIDGVPGMGNSELKLLLGDRLEQIENKPATPARADDAAFMVRQILRRNGSAQASVTWKIAGPDEIILTAANAGRQTLGRVKITGSDPADEKRLARIFATPAQKDAPPGLGLPPFREADVPTGLSYIRQDYHARGYWAAEVVEEKRDIDPQSGKVSLTIRVKPGRLHQLGQPTITAGGSAEKNRAAAAVRQWQGQPATTTNINAMRKAVEDSFSAAGFANARIAMSSRVESSKFIPEFNITEGKRVRLHRVTAGGFEKTDPARVERRLKTLEGDWFDANALNKRVRELLATGAFSAVRIETTPVGDDAVDAHVIFEEGRAREVTLAAGGDSYNGPIFRAVYQDRNIGGQVLGLTAGLEFTARGILGDVRLTDPWLFGSDWSGTGRFYSTIYGHEGYSTNDTGVEAILARKFTEHFRLELLGGTSYVNTDEDGLPASALGGSYYQHTRVRATPVWEYRDDPMQPTSGWYLKTPLQIGSALGGEDAGYASLGVNGSWFYAFSDSWHLALLGQGAMLYPTGEAKEFPIDLRFFNGGANTVRSFPERELGPSVNGYATGGNAFWAASAEIIRPLAGPLHLVGFVDAGAISLDYQDITSADVELAAGLGLRLNLPIGPVRFEYGYNLTRDPGEPSGSFHFAIGASF